MSDSTPAKPSTSTIWRQVLTNPVSLGAIATAYVTLNTAIFGYLSSKHAQELEQAKLEFQTTLNEKKYETDLVLEVLKAAGSDQQVMIHRLCALAATGLIPQIADRMQQRAGQCPPLPAP